MAKYTWTGKGKNNKKTKEVFENLKYINKLIVTALKKNDSSYSFDVYRNDMTRHISKSAYRHETAEIVEIVELNL